MELPSVGKQEENSDGKIPEEIRKGPWFLQADGVFSQAMKLTERFTPLLINT